METNDLTDSEVQIIRIIRGMKPNHHFEIWADREGRPGVYVVHEEIKRIIFPNKQIFIEVK